MTTGWFALITYLLATMLLLVVLIALTFAGVIA